MSELKAGVIVTPHDEGMCFNRGSDVIAVTERETEFYLKSEADKVIARHKYKRCLAMARWCHNQKEIYERDSYNWELESDAVATLRNKANIMRKWHKRWHELANEFKEAK